MSHLHSLAISKHAVDQYRARFADRLTEQEARDQLDDLARRAHVVKTHKDGTQEIRSPRPLQLRMAVGNDRGVLTVLTVKPPYTGPTPAYSLDAYPDTLPGGLLPLHIDPCPPGGVALGDTRAIHAMLTGAFGKDHNTLVPNFALLLTPTPSGWSVLHRDRDLALQWQGRSWRGHWFGRGEVRVTFGACSVPYTPEMSAPGVYRVSLTAHTPVCIRNSVQSKTTYSHPTAASLVLSGGATGPDLWAVDEALARGLPWETLLPSGWRVASWGRDRWSPVPVFPLARNLALVRLAVAYRGRRCQGAGGRRCGPG